MEILREDMPVTRDTMLSNTRLQTGNGKRKSRYGDRRSQGEDKHHDFGLKGIRATLA